MWPAFDSVQLEKREVHGWYLFITHAPVSASLLVLGFVSLLWLLYFYFIFFGNKGHISISIVFQQFVAQMAGKRMF